MNLMTRQAPNDPTPTMNSPYPSVHFGEEPAEHELVDRPTIYDVFDTVCLLCNLEFHVRYRDIR